MLVRAWRPDPLTRAGVGPIPASSGQTVRVRRNRSGGRQLNQALHAVVLTRLRTDPATRAYALRRRAQGKTKREIKRCLVRYVARRLYQHLMQHRSVQLGKRGCTVRSAPAPRPSP